MANTVTLARQERKKQGPWEVEVSYGGEADLHRHLAGCDKNPGHQKFVPVDQFNVDNLPPGCQDNDLVELIRAVSDLTVRVSVKHVSKGRPKKFCGSSKPYPCYKNRGRDMMRVGTGWVRMADINPDVKGNHYKICPCQECRNSLTPTTHFAHIYINTAAHVVYDSLEAADTTCHLFFDKGGTPDACSGVVTLSGGSVVVSDVDRDWCGMTFVTHDLDLADRLNKMVNHRDTVRERLREKLDRLETEKHKSSSHTKDQARSILPQRLKELLGRLELEKHIQSSVAEYLSGDRTTFHKRLKETLGRMETGQQKSSNPAEDLPDARDDLIIIVSHPHGCSKQISVGFCVDREEGRGRMYPRTYTTSTCPGSSGAFVWSVKCGGRHSYYWSYGFVHCGNCEGKTDLNFCSNYVP